MTNVPCDLCVNKSLTKQALKIIMLHDSDRRRKENPAQRLPVIDFSDGLTWLTLEAKYKLFALSLSLSLSFLFLFAMKKFKIHWPCLQLFFLFISIQHIFLRFNFCVYLSESRLNSSKKKFLAIMKSQFKFFSNKISKRSLVRDWLTE